VRKPLRESGSHKALIHIYLGGGPPHQDLWDIKTEAPKEIRGEFQPIPTNVPGIQICEVFPRLAKLMDKCVIIRSIVGAIDRHAPDQCMTGWPHVSLANLGGRPSVGAVVAKVQGPVDPAVPPLCRSGATDAASSLVRSGTAGIPRASLQRLPTRRRRFAEYET
jgi:hypothetical protein